MINNYPVLSKLGIKLLDALLVMVSFVLADYVRKYTGFASQLFLEGYMNLLFLILLVWEMIWGYQEAYSGYSYTSWRSKVAFLSLKDEILIDLKTVIIGCPIVYLVAELLGFFSKWNAPKSLLFFFAIINIILLCIEKIIIHYYLMYINSSEKERKNVIIVGTGDIAAKFISSVKENKEWHMKIIGLVDYDKHGIGTNKLGYEIIGSLNLLPDILHRYYIDEVIIALPGKYLGDIEDVMSICDREGITVRIVSPFFKNLISKARAEIIYGLPSIKFSSVERNDLEMLIKRLIDITLSLIIIILLTPLFAVISVIIKLDSPGPVLYKWKILGLNKKQLVSFKFRTMIQNADEMKEELLERNEMSGAAFKIKDDPRVTRVGKWLRKYSLDELPQLYSVLKGDLSLVGPRPPLQTEVELYEGWHRRKLSVKPGITCLWQISGRNEITDFNEWIKLDLDYIDNWSLWLDMKILFRTISAVLRGTGY